MLDLILSLFLEQGLVCMDEASARKVAQSIVENRENIPDTCGAVVGTVIVGKGLPKLYVFPSGLGLRVTEGVYLGKKVYFFRMEYSI